MKLYRASQGFQQQQKQQVGQRVDNQGQRRSNSFENQMLAFMGENKRLLNIHEKKFVEFRPTQLCFKPTPMPL